MSSLLTDGNLSLGDRSLGGRSLGGLSLCGRSLGGLSLGGREGFLLVVDDAAGLTNFDFTTALAVDFICGRTDAGGGDALRDIDDDVGESASGGERDNTSRRRGSRGSAVVAAIVVVDTDGDFCFGRFRRRFCDLREMRRLDCLTSSAAEDRRDWTPEAAGVESRDGLDVCGDDDAETARRRRSDARSWLVDDAGCRAGSGNVSRAAGDAARRGDSDVIDSRRRRRW